ncbi:ricin B-like lectin [Irpex lacteus]|nr:ricin B-like lectin [Irpex lacteus]
MAAKLENGIYFIQNAGTGTVLDLNGGSGANGTKIQGFAKRELNDPWVPAQLWIITKIDNSDSYTVENANGRTYVDLTNGLVADNTPIIGNQGPGGANQRWKFIRNTKKTAYVIQNEASKTYIDLYGGGVPDGTPVNGYAGSGADTTNQNQLWQLIRA